MAPIQRGIRSPVVASFTQRATVAVGMRSTVRRISSVGASCQAPRCVRRRPGRSSAVTYTFASLGSFTSKRPSAPVVT